MPETKLTPQDEICQTIAKSEPQYKIALPPHVSPERFVRICQTAVRTTPKLAACDRTSLYASFLQCAQTGLLPNGQEAVILPYGSTAKFMPMIGGITKLARNSGEIKTINAQVVYKNDEYEHWIDEQGEHFKHRPARGDRGEPILTYAVAMTKDGGVFFEEIDALQMAAIEKMSRASDSPWKGPFRTEMMRKSAIRRLLKYRVPSSTDIDDIIRVDDQVYEKESEPVKPAQTKSSRLQDIVDTQEAEPEAPVNEAEMPI